MAKTIKQIACLITFLLSTPFYIFPQCNALCYNPGFELGTFSGWIPSEEDYSITTPGFDPYLQQFGISLPMVSPFNGGNYSAMLGDGANDGANAGTLRYPVFISAGTQYVSYSYAVVFNDGGHGISDQPLFRAWILDSADNLQACPYKVYADTGANSDFIIVPGAIHNSKPVQYKPWTQVLVDVSAYQGQCITFEFRARDCMQGAHFGYAYIDMSCAQLPFGAASQLTCDSAATVSGPAGAVSYQWSGPLIVGSDTTQQISVEKAGVYTVTMTLPGGCPSVRNITVVGDTTFPTASFIPQNVCEGSPTLFTDNSLNPGGTPTLQWQWDFNGGGQTDDTNQNPQFNFSSEGTYTVQLTVNKGICTDDTSIAVTVYALPVVNFVSDDVEGCENLCVNFSDSSTVASGSITQWSWELGNGNTSTQKDITACYAGAGLYGPTLTVTSGNGCSNTLSKPGYITVYPNPVADFTTDPNPTTIMDPSVLFTNTSIDYTGWVWEFGDNSTDTSNKTTSHQYNIDINSNATTTYIATLTVVNEFGCRDSVSKEIVINPDFAFYAPTAFSPDGDGKNDYFFGSGIGIEAYELYVYDRWGDLIWKGNNANPQWNGTANNGNTPAQIDVYIWKANVVDVFKKTHRYVGSVALIK